MLRINPKMLQKHKIALFQQLVLKGFYQLALLEGTQTLTENSLRVILSRSKRFPDRESRYG